MNVTLKLPMPPSVNSIWRHGRNRRTGKPMVYLDIKYRQWKTDADKLLLTQKPLPFIAGEFVATITLDERKRRGDADNRAKAVLDCLQRAGVIANDKHCRSVTSQWGEADGCSVQLVKV